MPDALFSRSVSMLTFLKPATFMMLLFLVLVTSSSFAVGASRVTLGLVAEYNFLEGSGATVNDVSGVAPALNLTIDNTVNTQWLECGGLSVNSVALINSGVPATKIIDGVKASEALTVEAWIIPTSTSQTGPARIVTLSDGGYQRNVTLGQNNGVYQTRLRTTTAGDNGTSPYVQTSSNIAMSLVDLTHIVYTRDASGNAITYINGVVAVTKTVDGSVSNWDDSMQFALANELGTDRHWVGKLFHVAVYDRALSATEVTQNLNVGVVGTCGQAPSAIFSFEKVTGGVEYTVDFDASASYDTDGSIVNYAWDFGDEVTASGINTSHAYANAGQYTVTLVTTDDQGVTGQASQMVVVLASGRVVQDQVLFYDFSEGVGTTVNDLSGVGTPINLTIPDASKVSWLSCGGLSIDQATFISAATSPLKMLDAVQASNELTIEAWITPENTTQSGPARIVTYSIDGSNRNFTLGQNKANYDVRLRTTATNHNGLYPNLSGAGNDVSTTLTHVVYTRDTLGQAKLYKNGTLVKTATIGSSMDNWNNSYVFGLANENGTDRNWLGDFHLVAVYSRALVQQEVEQNFLQGGGDTCSNVNTAPVITAIADQTVLENTTSTISLSASDADNGALTFSVSGLPSFATFNGSGITVVPNYDAAGAYGPITVSVTDGEDTDSATFSLTVTNNNQLPEITSIPVTIISEGQSYQYNVVATDNDGDALTYSLGVAPSGMSINSLSGVIAWDPGLSSSGAELVIVNVTDGQQSVQQSFTLTISNTNQAPVLTAIADKTVIENNTVTISLSATDADNDALTYSIVGLPGFANYSGTEVTITPGYDDAGSYGPITVTATDGVDSDTDTFTIYVTNSNQIPQIISLPVTTISEGQEYQYSVVATDADADSLTYSLSVSPVNMNISLLSGVINWTPSFDDSGAELVVVEVSDGEQSVQQSFTLTIENTNQAPVITSAPIETANINENYQYSVIASDPDGGILTYGLLNPPAEMSIGGNGNIDWVPVDSGVHQIVVEVGDGLGLKVTQSFSIDVSSAPNIPPVFSSAPVLVAYVNETYSYSVATDDADGNSVSLELTQAPDGMTLSGGNKIEWIPDLLQLGNHPVTIVATDENGAEIVQDYIVTVTTPPTLASNQGKDFWLHNPKSSSYFNIYIASSKDTQGTIETLSDGVVVPFSVVANKVTTIELPNPLTGNNDKITNNTIHIQSDDDIAVYALSYQSYDSDAFSVLPTHALGTDHRVMSYEYNGSQFTAIASQDDTVLDITPSDVYTHDGTMYPAGEAFTVVLNQGQKYTLRGDVENSLDFTGTRLQSSKPIAVFGEHYCANIPREKSYCDRLIAQIPATALWGEQYITTTLASRLDGDIYRILADTDDTQIYLNDSLIITLEAGEFHEVILDTSAEINASKPILVAQFSASDLFDEGSRKLLPNYSFLKNFEQDVADYKVSHQVSIDSIGQKNYVMVVIKNDLIDEFTVDGRTMPSNAFFGIKGNTEYSVAQIALWPGEHQLDAAAPFGVYEDVDVMYRYADPFMTGLPRVC